MNSAHYSLSHHHDPRNNASLGDRDSGGLPLAFPSYNMTWPIKEIPHNNVANFYLAIL